MLSQSLEQKALCKGVLVQPSLPQLKLHGLAQLR